MVVRCPRVFELIILQQSHPREFEAIHTYSDAQVPAMAHP